MHMLTLDGQVVERVAHAPGSSRLHLLLNHIPVLGLGFGLAVLGWATFRPRPEFARLALVVFVVSALAAIPTYLSGEPAEDAIEGVASAIEPRVEPHEEAALVSLVLVEGLGVLGLVALWSARSPRRRLAR